MRGWIEGVDNNCSLYCNDIFIFKKKRNKITSLDILILNVVEVFQHLRKCLTRLIRVVIFLNIIKKPMIVVEIKIRMILIISISYYLKQKRTILLKIIIVNKVTKIEMKKA